MGFRRGKNCNNNLYMLKLLIEDHKLHKRPLYFALLDIKKAYDTVPFEALKLGMERLKMPENIINIFESLSTNRQMQIATIFGNTPTSLTFIAFADDLIPWSNSMEELQQQLDTIHSFIDMWQMAMHAGKSSIVTNRTKLDAEQEMLAAQFNLGNVLIHDLKFSNDLFRVLGAFWTTNSDATIVRNRVLQTFNFAMQTIQTKYAPGHICTNILNTVIIPKLQYMLQLCPLNKTFVKKINVALRKKTSAAHLLQSNINKFYDPSFGIGLFELGSRVDGQEITNLLMHMRSDSITGDVLRKCIASFDKFHKLPMSITEAPTRLY